MHIMNTSIATLFAAALLGFSGDLLAQAHVRSDSAFTPVHGRGIGPTPLSTTAFEAIPANPQPGQPYPSHAGSWLQMDNVGAAQASIQAVRLYAYALSTGVYQHVQARFRFWNRHEAAADPVFDRPVEFIVDFSACPCNFVAGEAYAVDVVLPKPVFSESAAIGFSQLWLTDPGNGVLSVSSELVPAMDRQGIAPQVGSIGVAYGNAGRSPDDLDFMPADAIAPGGLGLGLFGEPMQLDVCTGASGFQHQFQEEFDDPDTFFQRWNATPNFGQLEIGSGYLALAAPGGAAQFPYVRSEPTSIVIPPTGDFMVRWIATYTGVGPSGDGELVISTGTPLNGGGGDAISALAAWQDSGGFQVSVNTASGTQQLGGGQGTTRHDIAYCWVNGAVEVWKDGQILGSPVAQPAQRPDAIWFGNPEVAGGGPWNPVRIDRVWVRGNAPVLSDRIFRDDFEQAPGQP